LVRLTPAFLLVLLTYALLFDLPVLTRAAVGGSISGTVKDPSDAAVLKATVSVVNLDTGVRQVVTTDAGGAYSLPAVPVGHYDLLTSASGFKPYRRVNATIDVNSALLIDAVLELGPNSETITVNETAVRTETESTQLGEVIGGTSISALPLNGHSYTDLLALQPGVAPTTTITSLTVQGS
jgi:hypothetical protein